MRLFARSKARHGLPGSYSGWSAVARQALRNKPCTAPLNLRPALVRPYPQETTR